MARSLLIPLPALLLAAALTPAPAAAHDGSGPRAPDRGHPQEDPAQCGPVPSHARGPSAERWDDRARDSRAASWLSVRNPTALPVTLSVDGREVGRIEAGGATRLGPFAAGDRVVRAIYTLSGLTLELHEERLDLRPGWTRPLVLPADGPGVLVVANRWVEPVKASIDGRLVGSVPASGEARLGPFEPGRHTLVLAGPSGAVYLRRAFEQEPMTAERQALVPPRTASVAVVNRTGRSLSLRHADGHDLGVLRPGESIVPGVATGRHVLVASLPDGRVALRESVLVHPWGSNRLEVRAPARADLVVANPFAFTIQIYRDGVLLGHVGGHERRTFDVDAGSARYAADRAGPGGARFEARIVVDPWDGAHWRIDPRSSRRWQGNQRMW